MFTESHLQNPSTDRILISPSNKTSMETRISAIFGENWNLSKQSILFFCRLSLENAGSCDALLTQLQFLCNKEGRALSLQATHVDTVIASWYKLQQLPFDILSSLDTYLHQNQNRSSVQSIIQALRVEHAPHLTTQAEQHHLQHHTVYHALEVKARSMALLKQLDIFNTNSEKDVFLREIISFMIEFHDDEQKDRKEYSSVEQVTAAQVATRLIDALELRRLAPELIPLIEICADWIIVLGTTMIWGPNSTMDLSELFFLFDNASRQAGMGMDPISNHPFTALLSAISLIAGLCDKNPAASQVLMEQEAAKTAVLNNLRASSAFPLITEQFLNSTLAPYFPYSPSLAINQQAWLTTWPPHFNMRLELSLADPHLRPQAIRLGNLLKDYQTNYISGMDNSTQRNWLDNECTPTDLRALIETLFFTEREKNNVIISGIMAEQKFSQSQMDTLAFVFEKVPTLLQLWDERTIESTKNILAIESTVPAIDAQNLSRLKNFYFNCSSEDKTQFCYELFSIAGRQMGTYYVSQPGLGYQPPVPIVGNFASSCRPSFSELLACLGIHRSSPIQPELDQTTKNSVTMSLSLNKNPK